MAREGKLAMGTKAMLWRSRVGAKERLMRRLEADPAPVETHGGRWLLLTGVLEEQL